MSWHYSRALVEEYLAANSSDGERFALLKSNPTPQAFLSPDRMTAFSRLSRFGMTFAPLTENLGGDVLTWFLEGFHARTSAAQEGAQELQENEADSGKSFPESFAKLDPVSCSWKTHQYSLAGGLESFSETWPRWGMMQNGESYLRQMPEPLTGAKESGFWPTPVADGDRSTNYAQGGMSLGFAVRNYATPQMRDFRTGQRSRWENPARSRNLNDQIGGSLNPTWVEWLMGWPLGWTDLKPLETDKFREWWNSHGKL